VEKYAGKKIIKTHCVIHQQVVCSKVLHFEHVMSVVVSTVNCIRSRGLTHRLFRAFHEEVSANYSDLLCLTEARCLSSGRVLQRFVALRDEIVQFLEICRRNFPELHDEKWNNDLYFLCDVTCHLNELNMQLQGKAQLIF
jgi:hypothetical protein